MSTTTQVPDQQAQIDALKAELEKLQALQAARTGLPGWLLPAVKWVQSKGGWAHVAVLGYAGIYALIAGVPQVHALFIETWAHSPKWLVEALGAVGPIIAFYKSPKPSTSTSEVDS